jgi:NAD(P)-dependent dehydrogenase (short-subunit alcohol dehydrogenase family)
MRPCSAAAAALGERRLESLTALVTGAGRGLGRAIAGELAAQGAEVVLVSRSLEEVEAAAAAIRAAGGKARGYVCDVTDTGQVTDLIARAGAPDILVNNAGTNIPRPFTDVDEATFGAIFDVNVAGTFFTTQAVVRQLLRSGAGGSIINVSSQMGHVGAANRSVYCASKHAVEGLTKALAVELAPHGIRVNSVAPTYLVTPMTEPFLADPGFRADSVGRIPMGRLGTVDDVLPAVVFLADPCSAFITGHSLLVDGGYTAQ